MLRIPVYARNGIYYFHIRISGKQFKRSLHTSDKSVAKIKALQYLGALAMTIDPSKIRKYHIDMEKGTYHADGAEDHRMMMDAVELIGRKIPAPQAPRRGDVGMEAEKTSSLRLPELADKFFELRKNLRPATVQAYKAVANEFAGYIGNPQIHNIGKGDVVGYQEHLSKIYSNTRTIDNKIVPLSSLFKFAIKRNYYFGENPAAGLVLTTKKDKARGGYEIFEGDEIQTIYNPAYLEKQKQKDPDFYWCIVLGLISGARISEITSLEASQVRATPVPHIKIHDSKTLAGIREIPIPQSVYDGLKSFMPKSGKIFKYKERLGKGSGNAVSQKFKRQMQAVGVTRDGLVFHSLRKYLNDGMKKSDVRIEARCQFFGHELDNVNDKLYASEYSTEDLARLTLPVQQRVLDWIKYK